MSIAKMSSSELNKIFENTKIDIKTIENNIDQMKSDMQNKLFVLRHEHEFIAKQLSDFQSGGMFPDQDMHILSKSALGQFQKFGAVVHPNFIKPPINVFNIKTTNGYYFRSDVSMAINNIVKTSYTASLMQDSLLSKEICFEEYDTDTLILDVYINEENILGPTKCNMIEIDPFLPGSFDITKIEISTYDKNQKPKTITINSLKDVGKSRFLLNEKIEFYKISFHVKLKHSTIVEGQYKYPFGLKHIYFYNADFKTDSFGIVTIKADTPISIIKDIIRIKTPFGIEESTIKAKNIEIFAEKNSDGELEVPVYESTPTIRNEIIRETTELYAKIPIDAPITGISFNIETR